MDELKFITFGYLAQAFQEYLLQTIQQIKPGLGQKFHQIPLYIGKIHIF